MAAPAPARVCREHESVLVAPPAFSAPTSTTSRKEGMRFIGIDVHRDSCEVYMLGDDGEEGATARAHPRALTS